MGKKNDLINSLRPLLNNPKLLDKFLLKNSNLPSPRANLELIYALAENYDNLEHILSWMEITEDKADTNDPQSFLPCCGLVCMGKLYPSQRHENILTYMKQSANDGRWRIREAVTMGFQQIGEVNFNILQGIVSKWLPSSNNLEKRAILVSLAHPPFLNEQRSAYCLEVTDYILSNIDYSQDLSVLQKGLNFTISVFVANNPLFGFEFIKKWIKKDKFIDKVIQENLKKNRLKKKYPSEVQNILQLYNSL